MSKKYTLENMRSDYRPVCNDTFVSGDLNDTAADDSEEYSYSPGNEDVPYVGTDTSSVSAKVKEKAIDTKMKTIRLVATSALEDVKGKQNIKVCRVTENGIEHRLICLMNRIADKKRFSSFESQLKTRISSNGTLEFKAEVAEKGNDLYLSKFA